MKKDLQIIVSLKEYEELLEGRSKIIDALQQILIIMRKSHLKLEDILKSNKIDYLKENKEHGNLISALTDFIRSKEMFIGFDLEGKLIINEH